LVYDFKTQTPTGVRRRGWTLAQLIYVIDGIEKLEDRKPKYDSKGRPIGEKSLPPGSPQPKTPRPKGENAAVMMGLPGELTPKAKRHLKRLQKQADERLRQGMKK
jgi:hypothetical protein